MTVRHRLGLVLRKGLREIAVRFDKEAVMAVGVVAGVPVRPRQPGSPSEGSSRSRLKEVLPDPQVML
jgi:hypothetical protein